jgi:hypothetical protein
LTKLSVERPKITLLTCFTTIVVVAVLVGLLYFAIQYSFPAVSKPPSATQMFTEIPAPTVTPIIVIPTVQVPPNVTIVPTPAPPGEMGIGAYVQISGTGGDGLRLRAGPGTSNPPLFLGSESEVFLVTDGPKNGDGFTWWYLAAPYDDKRKGWAVQNYLSVITDKPTPKP